MRLDTIGLFLLWKKHHVLDPVSYGPGYRDIGALGCSLFFFSLALITHFVWPASRFLEALISFCKKMVSTMKAKTSGAELDDERSGGYGFRLGRTVGGGV